MHLQPLPPTPQPTLHCDAESTSLMKPVGRYLHVGWRLSIDIVGYDEVSVEEGVSTGWAGTLLVQAGLEGHMALREGHGGFAQLFQAPPTADLSPWVPFWPRHSPPREKPKAGTRQSCHHPAFTGLPEHCSFLRDQGQLGGQWPYLMRPLSFPVQRSPCVQPAWPSALRSHLGRGAVHREKELRVGWYLLVPRGGGGERKQSREV